MSGSRIETDAVNHGLFDTVRGVRNSLQSNTTTEARTAAGATEDLYAFGSDGFSVGVDTGGTSYINCNESSKNYASWNWKAGGTASTNGNGSITSSVSANPTAGFSIATYTGNALAATIGHGLSQAPELVIVKNRTTVFNWLVGGPTLNPDAFWQYALLLSSTAAAVDETAYFGYQTAATATTFPLGNSVGTNDSGDDYVAYCFHSVEGYSKVGSYEGNVNNDGPFVYCGFRPAWIMVKCSDAISGWDIVDNKRDIDNAVQSRLYPQSNGAEETMAVVDFLSNGFKVRTTSGNWNSSTSHTQIYLAFAESPFKYSNAR